MISRDCLTRSRLRKVAAACALVGALSLAGVDRCPAQSSRPEIGFITEPVRNYEPFLLFGQGLDDPKLQVIAWEAKGDDPGKLLPGVVKSGLPTPPATPPSSGPVNRLGRVGRLTSQALGAVMQGTATVIWVQGAKGLSQPYVVNRPRLFFVEHDSVAPGQESRLFGNYLVANLSQPKPRLWLVDRASGKIYDLPWGTKYDYQGHLSYQLQYELRFRVPAQVPPGAYELWAHNGAGAALGFGEPLPLRVARPVAAREQFADAKKFGAKGDGIADDTVALEKAIAATATAGGGVVQLAPGKYLVSHTLRLRPKVVLRGVDKALCHVVAKRGAPAAGWQSAAVLLLDSDCSVEDLTLRGNDDTEWVVRIHGERGPAHDVRVRDCAVVNPFAPLLEAGKPARRGGGVRVVGAAERVEISHCDLRAMSGLEATGGPFRRCRTRFNTYRAYPTAVGPHGTTQMGWIAGDECVIEGNVCEFANRGFTCGPWFGPVRHNFIARNLVLNSGVVDGGGESYLFEAPDVGSENWFGHPSKSGPNFLEQQDQTWKPHELQGRVALVVSGTGLGQYRVVADNTANRVTLTRPWRILPDETSLVVVRQFFFENLLVNNTSRNTWGGLELTGALGNVVDRFVGQRSRTGIWFGGYNTGVEPNRMPYGPVAFNDVRNSLFDDCGSKMATGGILIEFTGLRFWAKRRLERLQPMPVILGNRVCNNQFERCGILVEDQVLQSKPSVTWLPADDPRRKAAPPANAFNAFGGNQFRGNGADEPDIRLDPWTAATFLWLPPTRGGAPVTVRDDGRLTAKFAR
jgi:hypothetical protein